MNNKILLLVALAFSGFVLKGQNQVRWLTFEEALAKSKIEPRKIFINVHTSWCGWCKKMDHVTYSDDKVAKYLNENFYPVKFNAEYRKDIEFKGKTYSYIKTYKGGYHGLATYLLNGKLSFPSIVVIDENLDVIQSIPGFQNHNDLDMILHYFGENHHKSTPWRRYTKVYQMDRKIGFPVKSSNH